ncbi:hypothetical protein [Dyella sp. 20L07]|uniref:hypothetical protein n=1 Tax=Dyella sp. 20L07 TaxID=3384240 RepID=UPI003D2C13F0
MSLHACMAQTPRRAESLHLRSDRLGRCLWLIHEPASLTTPVVVVASAAKRASADPQAVGLPIAISGAHGDTAAVNVEAFINGPDVRELHVGGTTFPLDIAEVPAVRAWLDEVYGNV